VEERDHSARGGGHSVSDRQRSDQSFPKHIWRGAHMLLGGQELNLGARRVVAGHRMPTHRALEPINLAGIIYFRMGEPDKAEACSLGRWPSIASAPPPISTSSPWCTGRGTILRDAPRTMVCGVGRLAEDRDILYWFALARKRKKGKRSSDPEISKKGFSHPHADRRGCVLVRVPGAPGRARSLGRPSRSLTKKTRHGNTRSSAKRRCRARIKSTAYPQVFHAFRMERPRLDRDGVDQRRVTVHHPFAAAVFAGTIVACGRLHPELRMPPRPGVCLTAT